MRPGEVLAEKYRIIREIGRGGMGVVYEAEHALIGKRLAVKTLWPNFTENEEAVRRFTWEAKAAAAIGHPAIIDIHDIGATADGSQFLVMEFLEGQSLSDLFKKRGALEPPMVAYVLCQILSALDAAHGKGIVHRDLKPDNIFLVDTGQALPAVKLLDFGISKIVAGGDDCAVTRTGATIGTAHYMSPEQAQGSKEVDHLTDVWAAGVILYELLTGTRPFKGDSYLALAGEVISGTPMPPRELRPELPAELERVILTALSKEKESRQPSAKAMLEELLPFVEEHARGQLALGKRAPPAPAPRAAEKPPAAAPDVAAKQGADHVTVPVRLKRELAPGHGAVDEARAAPPETTEDRATEPTPPSHVVVEEPASAPAPESAGPGRVWQTGRAGRVALLATVGGCALLLAGVGIWAVASSGAGEGAATTAAAPEVEPAVSGEAGPAPARPDAAVIAPADVVSISLAGVPDEARVLLDGQAVDGRELRGPRSTEPHEVRVELAGFEPWVRHLSFERSETVEVTLAPSVADAGASPQFQPRPPRPPGDAAPGPEPRRSDAGSSGRRPPASPPPLAPTPDAGEQQLVPDPTNPYGGAR